MMKGNEIRRKPVRKMWVDISVTVQRGMVHWPGDPAIGIKRVLDIDKGDDCNVSRLSIGSHTGTHMDAPLHFLRKGKGLDKMPIEATIGPARVIKINDRKSIKAIELKRHRIRKGDRILFKTSNSRYWKSSQFRKNFVYIAQDAAEYLADKKVRAVGIDYLSVGGFYHDGIETHQALLRAGIWVIEGLNLLKVSAGRYHLVCLPIKVLNSDGPRLEPCFIRNRGEIMQYKCSVCGEKIDGGLLVFIKHTETHIINHIKKDHPDWVEDNGVCPRCENFYRQQLKGEK